MEQKKRRQEQRTKKEKSFILSFVVMVLICVMPVSNIRAEETPSYLQESLEVLENPERGFYEPIGYELKVDGNKSLDLYGNLIHLRVGISAFSKAANGSEDLPFTQNMLDALDGTLKNVKKNGGSVIIRFAYDDFEGIGDLEPSMDMMLMHISQLKSVFEENADVITYVELGLFGPWGEMHTSEMCTTENVSVVLDAMLEAVPEEITIGVRTPRYYAKWANIDRKELDLDITKEGTPAYRVGLYNDGYLGSESDLGTFSNRKIEIAWLSNQACHTFYGGEVVANRAEGEPLNTVAFMSKEAFETHTTYLNLYWNNTVIDNWKEEIYQGDDTRYQGQSGFTYVINHLGYRYVLRQCQIEQEVYRGQSFNMNLKLENVGFANLINNKKVSVLLKGKNSTYEILTDIDAKQWNSTEITNVQKQIMLPADIELGEYEIYLRISKYGDFVSDNNYQCIQFANDGIWNNELGANKIGSIHVLGEESGNTPKEPGKTPEEPGETPEEPGKTPEEPGKTPEEPGETPEKPEENPEDPGDMPETPGDTKKDPEDIQKAPGDFTKKPGEGENIEKDTNTTVLVNEVVLTGISHKIAAGKKLQLKAKVLPYNATNQTLKWTSSNKKYATVNKNGLVKVKKAGAGHVVTIKAMSTDGSRIIAKYKITIMKKAVKKINLKVQKKDVKAGKKIRIRATVTPNKNVNGTLQYLSSNTKYATVNKDGIIKTKKAGKGKIVKIQVLTTDGSGLKKIIRIKIK